MSADEKEKRSAWPMNPDYTVYFDPLPAHLDVEFCGEVIASTDEARVMFELAHSPVYYLPRGAINPKFLQKSDRRTHCPYKGWASYWDLKVGDRVSRNAVWSYEDPYPEMAAIKNYMSIYWGRMDCWKEDGVAVEGPREIPGRVDHTTQLRAMFPELAKEWHPTRNSGISPYEFAADSDTEVWWLNAEGEEWKEKVRSRTLAATSLRNDGDGNPYENRNPYPADVAPREASG